MSMSALEKVVRDTLCRTGLLQSYTQYSAAQLPVIIPQAKAAASFQASERDKTSAKVVGSKIVSYEPGRQAYENRFKSY